MNMESEKKNQAAAVDKRKKSDLQRVLDVPFIGEYFGLFIGLLPPFLLDMVIRYLAFGNAGGESHFIFLALIFVWNLLLFLGFRVLTTAPILPIPLFVIGFVLCIVEIVRYFRS
jgi:hypothetical protein